MKSFIKHIAAFTGFTIVFYCVAIIVWGTFAPPLFKPNLNYELGGDGHLFSRIKEIEKFDGELDVLFLGSSHAYRGFDPRNFPGLNTFNLGSSSQTPMQTDLFLTRYLDKLNPKLIVYEVYPGTFAADGVESSLDIIANDENDLNSIKMALRVNHIKTYNALIYGFFADLSGMNDSFKESAKKANDIYVNGGYVEKKLQFFKKEKDYSKTRRWKLRDKQVEIFGELVQKIKDKNIKLILVQAPVTTTLYNSYINNDSVNTVMKSYGVPYYNFSAKLPLDDFSDFYDAHHLNQNGVNIFNKEMVDILNEELKNTPPKAQ